VFGRENALRYPAVGYVKLASDVDITRLRYLPMTQLPRRPE
jgi:hypothetical protein